MPRRRFISTQISLDAEFNLLAEECGEAASEFFLLMIPHASDDATISGDPDELYYTIIPRRRKKTVADVANMLEAIARYGLIEWDKDRKIIYFSPDSFYRYQSYIPIAKRRIAEASDNQRKSAKNSEVQQQSAKNPVILTVPSLTKPVPPPISPPEPSPLLATFFTEYERGLGLMATSGLRDQVMDFFGEYPNCPVEWVKDAIAEAVAKNARNWKYIKAILVRWLTEGKGDRRPKKTSNFSDGTQRTQEVDVAETWVKPSKKEKRVP